MKIVFGKIFILTVCFLNLNLSSLSASHNMDCADLIDDICGVTSSSKTDSNDCGSKIDNDDFILLSKNLKTSKSCYQRLEYFNTTDPSILETRKNIFEKFSSIKERIEGNENNVFGNKQKAELKQIISKNNDLFALTVTCRDIERCKNFQDSKELNDLFNSYLKELEQGVNEIHNLLMKIEN